MTDIPSTGLVGLSRHVAHVQRLAKLMKDEEHQRFDHVIETAVVFGYTKLQIREAFQMYLDEKVIV